MRAKDERRYIRKETHLPPHTFSIPMKKKTHHDVMSFLEYKYEKKRKQADSINWRWWRALWKEGCHPGSSLATFQR